MNDMAGFVRVRGEGDGGFPVIGLNTHVDVCQQDGTWIPLRGVCGMTISLQANDIVSATVDIELGAVDFEAMVADIRLLAPHD